VILGEAEALLDPVSDIDGFMLACLVDASTGMVLASRKDRDEISLPMAAAGAADIANVLSLLAGLIPVDGLEDVMVTFRRQLYMIRLVREDPEPQILLLVILDRNRVNLGSCTSGTGRSRTPNRTGRQARRRTPLPSRRRTCRR
jgi:hypothetical protein